MKWKSMTGFGRGEASAGGVKVEVEISSVNRRQFDVRLSLPRAFVALESRVHAMVHEAVARGSVSGTVRISAGDRGLGGTCVDTGKALEYLREIRAAAKKIGLKDDLTIGSLLQLPGVVRPEAVPEDSEQVWPLLRRAMKTALGELVAMRKREGQSLQKDIARRLDKLKQPVERIRRRAPGVTARYAKALRQRLRQSEIPFDREDPQLLRELALFADRSNITEELVRLESHFKQAGRLMTTTGPVGRALDFLCQEMFREINTIGSKANDASLARDVIGFKTILESVREQVQNVE